MSVLLILTVSALLLMFISIFGGIRSQGSGKELVSLSTRIPIGVLGMLIIIFLGFYFGAFRPVGQTEFVHVGNKVRIDYPVERVQVTSPLDGDQVECRILTMGVYPEASDDDIWVVLKPTDDRYYPQSDYTNVSYKRNGRWQVLTRFGGDLGESFELIVYTADDAASEFFSTTIQSWKDDLSYPGLNPEEIPSTAIEVARINLSLKDNCRGVF